MGNRCKNFLYSTKEAWLFITPALLGTFLLIIFPIFFSFGLSFFEWNLLDTPIFVGLKNYTEIFTEPKYLQVLWNTFFYAVCVSVFGVTIPLGLAYLVARKFFCSEGFKLVTFLPYITPMVVIGTVWAWIFEPNSGLINSIFQSDLKWLYDTNLAMGVLIFVSVWKLVGYNMLLYLTGFAGINNSLLEAAEIDGAGDFAIFSRIVVPMLTPTIVFVTVVTIISSFQVFDLIYMMTQGGPDGATEVLVYSVFKEGFEYFNAGRSCALGYVLFAIVFVFSLLSQFLKPLKNK